MDDWVQLTEKDVERAHRLARASPPEPEVITITDEDVAVAGSSNADVDEDSEVLTITAADLLPAAAQPQASPDLARLERRMFHLLNATRQHHLPGWIGTGQLLWHEELAAVSRQHSADMLQRQYVAHVTPEGIRAAQRLQKAGIKYLACGENIGIVYGRAAHGEGAVYEIHNAFMSQPRSLTNHRGNLLNPIWTHVGIGIAYNPDGALVATQNFVCMPGRRRRVDDR